MKRYKSQFMETFIKEITFAMKQIAGTLKTNNINFCFIGGSILFIYDYRRVTDDIDILIAKKDKSKFNKLINRFCEPISSGSGSFTWFNPNIEVDVIYEGKGAGNDKEGIKYLNPDLVKNNYKGIPVLTLEKLIEYKISSGMYGKRLKDFADVIELITSSGLPENFGDEFREDLKNEYVELWHKAKEQIDM